MPLWRKMVEEGRDPPPEYFDQPEVWQGSEFYWRAFSDLSSDRGVGMGLGPIPFSSMLRYARLHDVTGIDEFERFQDIIGGIDAEYLSLNAPKDSTDSKMRSLVPVTDSVGVGAILDRLGKK